MELNEKKLSYWLFASMIVLINALFEGDHFWRWISSMVAIPCLFILIVKKLQK